MLTNLNTNSLYSKFTETLQTQKAKQKQLIFTDTFGKAYNLKFKYRSKISIRLSPVCRIMPNQHAAKRGEKEDKK